MEAFIAVDLANIAASASGVEQRIAACQADQPVRVGLLLNPRARRLVGNRARSRLHKLLPPDRIRETQDLASLRRALGHLLCDARVNVLATAGGDGTVHHVVNALLALSDEARQAVGTAPPLPRILILNGGTLNIVGRTLAIHGPPQRTLTRFLRAFGGRRLSQVPARAMPAMVVAASGERPRCGFVFGSEVLYHSIELYMRFGAGYGGLSRFLFELARGALTGGELWQREAWKLGPFGLPLIVDGETYNDYAAVVASTVDLTLAIGSVRAIRRPLGAAGFHAKVIAETEARRILTMIPALVSERSGAGIIDHPNARSMRLYGPFTLDGELYGAPALPRERVALSVDVLPDAIYGVPGEFGIRAS